MIRGSEELLSSFTPPSLLEIFLFPIAGVLITESVRTAVYVSFRLLARWQWITTQAARPQTMGAADH